ncbi:MAG: DUF4468 domain-containing protein [Bacteroidota bacterium]
MKKLLLLLFFIKATACFAQKDLGLRFKAKDAKTIYQAKGELHKSKGELYQTAKKWADYYFKSPKSMLLNEDKAAGILYGKGFLFVKADQKSSPYKLGLTMQIDCKDNYYKIRLYDFQFLKQTTTPNGRLEYSLFKPDDLMASLNKGGKIKNLNPRAANQLLQNFSKESASTIDAFVKAMGSK